MLLSWWQIGCVTIPRFHFWACGNKSIIPILNLSNSIGLKQSRGIMRLRIKAADAIGIVSKSGRYGGTYAHTDIAFEFASWISPEFKLYIIKDYQRLKKDEANRLAIGWDAKRELSKINYRIHTDAVKEFLITPTLSPQEMADILNMALFGKTAAQWRSEKGISGKTPNIRDFASAEELVVLINLEDTNADLIRQEVPKIERLKILREKAYRQLELLKH